MNMYLGTTNFKYGGIILLAFILIMHLACGGGNNSSKSEEEAEPKTADEFYNRGIDYFDIEDYNNALNDFSKALRMNPKLMEARYERGCAYIELENWNKAMLDLSVYLESIANERSFKAYERRGYAYLRMGEFQKAIDDCNKALNLNPGYMKAITTKGKAIKGKRSQ